jgi:PAS domain S-box-containing protein
MPSTEEPLAQPPANVLLVDDEPANLLALEAVLAGLGRLVRATSGAEALRLLLEEDFAVVLLDVQMKGLDGFDTAQLIRSRDRTRHTPIIFLTAYESADFPAAKAYTLGAVDYLLKPLTPVILRAKVAFFIELFQKTERVRALEREAFERRLAADSERLTRQARDEQERFRLVAENVQDFAIFLLAPAGLVVSWNAGAERILGYRAEEVLGRSCALFFTPEDIADGRPERELREAAETGRSGNDCWLVRKGGGRFWASGVTTALRDGGLRGYVKILRDLTERRALEDELRRRADELAERDHRKDEWIALLAHELRNPLASVLTSLHVLRQESASPAVRGESLDRAERQVRHLSRLVDGLLEASRVLLGRVRLRSERLDLARLVRTAAEDQRAVLGQAGVTLEVETPETPVWVEGDATRLTQALNNLLDNSLKFSAAGGRVSVRLEADAGAGRAVLTVSDTGAGIESKVLPRLFEPFSQAEQGLDRQHGGLGLGLAVVKGLVELHGGGVEAASGGPGRGATFTVRLPLGQEPPALATVPKRPSASGRHSRILVIEDNKDAADSLRMLLSVLGHEVRVAFTGPAGVQAATEWLPEVVLSDIGLPGFDGFEVARRLRRQPGMEGAMLVALTGYGGPDDRRRGLEAGFDHYLTKPTDPADLQRLLAARVA